MHVESSRLARVRAFELSPSAFLRIGAAAVAALYLIVISGSLVRLTASGLGCESWPGCQAGSFFPEASHHGWIEFGNRLFSLFPIVLSVALWVGARRTPGLPRWAVRTAAATVAGTLGQAPLGFVTIYFDLHPLLVMAHFLLALAVLAGAVVVAVEAWVLAHGRAAAAAPGWLRRAVLVLAAACAVLVVTGTFATAAGPHSGSEDIRRLGNLADAVYVHVRATAVFGVLFLVVLGALWRRRREAPGLLAAGLALLGVLLVQMAVGEIQWRSALPWAVVLVHVALAAAVWALTVLLAALAWRTPAPLTRRT